MTFEYVKTLRPSGLTTFADCERRWAARNAKDLVDWADFRLRQIGQSIGAAVGGGIHAGVEATFKEKLETGGSLTRDAAAVEAAVAEFDRRLSEQEFFFDDTTNSRQTGHKQLQRMTMTYRQTLGKALWPAGVEERRQADLGDGWTASGQVDQLATADAGGLDIHDLKSGTQRRSNAIQYGTYSLIFKANGYDIKRLYEDFLPRVRLNKEQPPPTIVPINLEDAEMESWVMVQRVKFSVSQFIKIVESGGGRAPQTAFKPNPLSPMCSDRYCPAWGTAFCTAHKVEIEGE